MQESRPTMFLILDFVISYTIRATYFGLLIYIDLLINEQFGWPLA